MKRLLTNDLIDTHCHILPGVDDGPRTMEESLHMMREAADCGIRTIIATPHFHPKKGDADPVRIFNTYQTLKSAAKKRAIPVRLYLGQEIFYTPELPEWLDEHYCFTMNDTDIVMIEFAKSVSDHKIFEAVDLLSRENYRPIIAHAEKYESIRDTRDIEDLLDMGAYIQINAGAVLGEDGGSVRRFVKQLMDLNLISTLGSDAHAPGGNFACMQKAYAAISKKFSSMYAGSMITDTPRDIFKVK